LFDHDSDGDDDNISNNRRLRAHAANPARYKDNNFDDWAVEATATATLEAATTPPSPTGRQIITSPID
jgi:hypothetical protein